MVFVVEVPHGESDLQGASPAGHQVVERGAHDEASRRWIEVIRTMVPPDELVEKLIFFIAVGKPLRNLAVFGSMGYPDHDDCIAIINQALDAGINFVDSADVCSPRRELADRR